MSDIDAYLGDVDVTDEQHAAIERAARGVDDRYPEPDDGSASAVVLERTAALQAAVQIILGDTSPQEIAKDWHATRRREEEARAALTGAIIALSESMTERAIASALGTTRMTVRKALGK